MDRLIQTLLASTELQNRTPLGLGLSGGLDSMVLAEALLRSDLPFRALHFNHNWRGDESRGDQEFVRRWCRQRKIPFTTHTWRHPKKDEASARQARHAFFQSASQRYALQAIALAHHQNDQAETLLIQLLRGTGPEGLASMRHSNRVNGLQILRPLLQISRSELRRIARSEKLEWREDSSNTDKSFARNKVRHQLLPYLTKMSDRDPLPLLTRTADILATENDYWETLIPHDLPARLPLKLIQDQHPAYQRRLLRRWLMTYAPSSPGFEDIEAIRALLTQTSPAKINLKQGKFCRRRAGFLFIE
jgi:tRNA(Ile)-lysidine synthase